MVATTYSVGDLATTLAEAAAAEDASLLVVGVDTAWQRVALRAERPVVVVRP